MIDVKDSKTQKWLLGIMMAAAIGYIWHSKVYQPAQAEIDTAYMKYEALQTQLKSVEMKFQSLDALKQEYYELTDRYSQVSQLLPEEDQLSPLLAKIHAAGLETSTRISDIEPKPPATEGFYDRFDFNLNVYSTYHDLGDFLARIANLPFIVNVGEVRMVTATEFGNPNRTARDKDNEEYTLSASLTLSTYKVKESERLLLAENL
jgi:type IV pilus assembly protein PilO